MKIITALAAAASLAALMPAAASAQRYQPMNQRHQMFERRVDMGIRNHTLTRNEASRLRTRMANLQRLEQRYSRNGLNYRERMELDRRYDALSNSIRTQRHDAQHGRMGYRHR